MGDNLKNLTNNEIKIKILKVENEYKALQNHIKEEVEHLYHLNNLYLELEKELNNRSRNFLN